MKRMKKNVISKAEIRLTLKTANANWKREFLFPVN